MDPKSKEINELKNGIRNAQTRIDGIYTAIGRTFYENNKNTVPQGYEMMFSDIDDAIHQIGNMETRIKFLNGIVECSNCKAENSVNSFFCCACGTRLPHTYTSDGQARCQRCGNALRPGQKFCGVCGCPVEENVNDNDQNSTDDNAVVPAEEVQEQTITTKTCPKCHTSGYPLDAVFCSVCGERL